MSATVTRPGLYFESVPRPPQPEPLRSDVAGFLGRTRRGPAAQPPAVVRVEGWREYLRMFGGLEADALTTYGIRGYFDNGGQVAHVVRLAGASAATARAAWPSPEGDPEKALPVQGRFAWSRYDILASSPGAWANGTRVAIRYRREGPDGYPVVDFTIQAPGEPVEILRGLDPSGEGEEALERQVERASALIRLRPSGERGTTPAPGAPTKQPRRRRYEAARPTPSAKQSSGGPRIRTWDPELKNGDNGKPSRDDYLAAVTALGDVPEVALLAAPDLYGDLTTDGDRSDVLKALFTQADALRDRLVLADVPPALRTAVEILAWAETVGEDEAQWRAAAVYHPWLLVADPLGGLARPQRNVPPSGPVAGLISRLDRERGAHHTPANAPLLEVVDVKQGFTPAEQAELNKASVNLVRCFPGRGLMVWGGRTLGREPANRFVAHRRLLHRLVRAIRRVAEPLVFDLNNPELWLTLARGVTTVLLEAYRGGGLKGARPEEAFQVRCNAATNPPESVDLGRVLCEIDVAPAVPMEFIRLRVALSAEGALEVFQS
jgi:hypothetical protein